MEEYRLAGHHVRIVWKELAPKTSNKPEQTVFRGQVSHQDISGLWLWGNFFVEKVDTISVREMPKDKEAEARLYFAPWSSIEVVQIVLENTRDFDVHKLVLSRRGDNPKETHPR
jgi:hypothetical protein